MTTAEGMIIVNTLHCEPSQPALKYRCQLKTCSWPQEYLLKAWWSISSLISRFTEVDAKFISYHHASRAVAIRHNETSSNNWAWVDSISGCEKYINIIKKDHYCIRAKFWGSIQKNDFRRIQHSLASLWEIIIKKKHE